MKCLNCKDENICESCSIQQERNEQEIEFFRRLQENADNNYDWDRGDVKY